MVLWLLKNIYEVLFSRVFSKIAHEDFHIHSFQYYTYCNNRNGIFLTCELKAH